MRLVPAEAESAVAVPKSVMAVAVRLTQAAATSVEAVRTAAVELAGPIAYPVHFRPYQKPWKFACTL